MAKSSIQEKFEAVVTRLVARNFDRIVGSLIRASIRLTKLAEKQEEQATALQLKANDLERDASLARLESYNKGREATRSRRVAGKISELVD